PALEDDGKNPFSLDSMEQDCIKFEAFIDGEVRYNSLKKMFPAEAEELFKAAQENALWRYKQYRRFASMDWGL
ncbi:MAG: hypothetical protein K2I68_01120, partial [Bacteroidales bacterium]|nr:hypothetical protein [Bacteroidales bacterium]